MNSSAAATEVTRVHAQDLQLIFWFDKINHKKLAICESAACNRLFLQADACQYQQGTPQHGMPVTNMLATLCSPKEHCCRAECSCLVCGEPQQH
jgi:hypothetical protein